MPLRDFISVIWSRKWIVAAVTFVTLAAALIASSGARNYTSTAQVQVRPISLNPQTSSTPGDSVATEEAVARSLPVAQIAAKLLAPPRHHKRRAARPSPQGLLNNLKVTSPTATSILVFSFSASDPHRAQLGARAFAQAYLMNRKTQAQQAVAALEAPLQRQIAQAQAAANRDQQIIASNSSRSSRAAAARTDLAVLGRKISVWESELAPLTAVDTTPGHVLQPASLPHAPSGPRRRVIALVGLLLGLALGAGAVLLLERIPNRVRSQADLEELLGAPVLVAVPPVSRKRLHEGPLTKAAPASPAAEAYRALAALTAYVTEDQAVKTLLVTSAERGDGRTITAVNLAAAAGLAGKRVAIVSADTGDQALSKLLGVNGSKSLGDVLDGTVEARDALQDAHGLKVLTSKRTPASAGLVRTDRLSRMLEQLHEEADLVVIEAPPAEAADTLAVAPFADGVLFVAKADKTSPRSIERARARLGMLGVRIVGGVLTDADPAQDRPRQRAAKAASVPSTGITTAAAVPEPDGNGRSPSAV